MDHEIAKKLRNIVGEEAIRLDQETLTEFSADQTENPEQEPAAVVKVRTVEQVQEIVKLAGAEKIPLTPRVAGTNLGGLTIAQPGGWILDLTEMNHIHSMNRADMVAVVEPGVTFGQLKEEMDREEPQLTIGYPLSPPETSVAANCLLDGLGNLSLKHGAMGDWINGLEVVRGDGSLLRTGSWALNVPVPFGRIPLPDLTGLFVSCQGTTGIVTKLAVQLWPKQPFRERSFVLAFDRRAALYAMSQLPRMDVLDDLGSLSWPTGKLLFGVTHPDKERDPAEPEFFLYMDIGAPTEELLNLKRKVVKEYFGQLRKDGLNIEDPIDMPSLLQLEPSFSRLAEFPTRLDFMVDHPDGGLTWVGTYGPISHFEKAVDRGFEISLKHGYPPMVVARPMKGGHFAVVRFIEVFRRNDKAEIARVAACNQEIADALLEEGYVMYKTPAWALQRFRDRFDPGFLRLLEESKAMLDPDNIMNPGRWKV